MGNSRARAVFEANVPEGFRRPQSDSALEAFIRTKYEQRKYVARYLSRPVVTFLFRIRFIGGDCFDMVVSISLFSLHSSFSSTESGCRSCIRTWLRWAWTICYPTRLALALPPPPPFPLPLTPPPRPNLLPVKNQNHPLRRPPRPRPPPRPPTALPPANPLKPRPRRRCR